MTARESYNSIIGNKVIKNLKRRAIDGYYVDTKEEALAKVIELIDEGASVSWGGSMSMEEIGVIDKLKTGNYKLIDRAAAKSLEEAQEIMTKGQSADYYLMSSNAITVDGILVNIDGSGNRITALIRGPKNVIIVVGVNKISVDLDEAMKRARKIAAPMNNIRLDRPNPCAIDGVCHDCLTDTCICCNIVITRKANISGRIKVVVVGEEVGY